MFHRTRRSVSKLRLEHLEERQLLALTSPTLIGDFNTILDTSIDSSVIRVGQATLLVGGNEATGAELYRYDDAAGSASLQFDLDPGPDSSFPHDFQVSPDNSFALFQATVDGRPGLWHTDGSLVRPVLYTGLGAEIDVKSISESGAYVAVTTVNETEEGDAESLYSDLWFVSADDASIVLVKSFTTRDDEAGLNYQPLQSPDGTFVFQHCVADDEECSLWTTDGTFAGTEMVATFGNNTRLISFGDTVYFIGDDGRYLPLKDGVVGEAIDQVEDLWGVVGSTFLFDESTGLYASDDISGPRTQLAGGDFGFPSWLNETHGYVTQRDAESGAIRLLATDGTVAGTEFVLETTNAGIRYATSMGEKAYFVVTNDTSRSLWVSNGTALGTREIWQTSDPLRAETRGHATSVSIVADDVWVTYDTVAGRRIELLRNDVSVTTLSDVWSGTDGTRLAIYDFGESLILETDRRLLLADTAIDSATPITDDIDGIRDVFVLNDTIWYERRLAGSSFEELWTNRGSRNTDIIASQFVPGLPSATIRDAGVFDDKLYFIVDQPQSLWVSDGTADGTERLLDLPGSGRISYAVNGQVYISASESAFEERVWWSTDGTFVGTQSVEPNQVPAEPDAVSPTFEINGFTYELGANLTWTATRGTRVYSLESYRVYSDPIQVANDVFFVGPSDVAGTYVAYQIQPGYQADSRIVPPSIRPYIDLPLSAPSLDLVDSHLIVLYDDGFNGAEPWRIPLISTIDVNEDEIVSCRDAAAIQRAFTFGESVSASGRNIRYDISGDLLVDQNDVDLWAARVNAFGDVTVDGVVDSDDLNKIALKWQRPTRNGWCDGDLNNDGRVSEQDLNQMALNWGLLAVTNSSRTPRSPLSAAKQAESNVRLAVLDASPPTGPKTAIEHSEAVRTRLLQATSSRIVDDVFARYESDRKLVPNQRWRRRIILQSEQGDDRRELVASSLSSPPIETSEDTDVPMLVKWRRA